MKFKRLLNFTKIYLLNILFALNAKSHEENSFNSDLIVQIKNGKLKGKDRVYYYSYENIPYAKAAVAELRFEPPQEYDRKWGDIFDATMNPVTCMQWNQFKEGENKLEGSEDCLYVNVYKPKTGKRKYPVLVYIHGGAFMFGSVDSFREDYLMRSGNLILVKIAYRLGPLGFLSTEDEVISGNYGLKDQAMALKWVKQNIHHFGGDNEKITLMGFSAGAASAHLQMLKPSLQTIAKTVVSISGVALNPWVIIKNPLKRAMKVAHNLNCPNLETTQAIKYCLKKKQAEEIVTSVKEFLNNGYNPFTTFGPVVEHENVTLAFMTKHPRDIIKSSNYSHLPFLASFTAQDGGYNAAQLLEINPKTQKTYLEKLNDKWLDLAPENLFLENLNEDTRKYAQQLKDNYLGNLSFTEENYFNVQKMYTDVLFKNGILEALKLHSENNKEPVYSYVYDNPPDYSSANDLAKRKDIHFGTVHSSDFGLIMNFPQRSLRSDEDVISQKFIKMLEAFVDQGILNFGECKFVNNAGNTKNLYILLISRDKCENIV